MKINSDTRLFKFSTVGR